MPRIIRNMWSSLQGQPNDGMFARWRTHVTEDQGPPEHEFTLGVIPSQFQLKVQMRAPRAPGCISIKMKGDACLIPLAEKLEFLAKQIRAEFSESKKRPI